MANQMYFEDVEIGMELTPIPKPVTTRKLVKYSGSSRDFNEIHYDQESTAKTMWGNVIVQGMLKAGCLAHLATDFMGTEGFIHKLGCTYRAPDFVNQTFTVHGRVVSKDETPDGLLVACDAWVTNPEGQTTTPGQFTVALPSRDGRTASYPDQPPIPHDRSGTIKGERLRLGDPEVWKSHIGEWWTPWISQVERPWITAFADAIGDPNPIFREADYASNTIHGGIVAPPTFVEAMDADWRVFELEFEEELAALRSKPRSGGGGGGGDGFCDYNFYADIHPGDTMSGYTRWTEPYEKTGRAGRLVFTTRESVIENQHGQVVSTAKRATVSVYPK
ncbi:MAG: hypothetical protein FI707_01065 [SAR202 cluster bacterium]|jgi:acyl dehydratase|nr:hypothetical protein [Chloroflexota bacterium]MDP6421735.1 MaoC family dehydratase N-terminal domain-containing protein [SAR202 cluster bacterium]HAL46302.1 hypothetical protein [Dehalococcoidia bacterium]MDP6664508.1 MaoC family dehydratase N-terminal domain-containing protein [SAR202 cluster bacterium]MQG58749.1 hypothetical protein [SAR202 cluster bacterium]|tara:strand:- start:638 stop:1636 length:999 start_codon:yes stop_codon:yes gene_type:complete